jgi:hypothetical protein
VCSQCVHHLYQNNNNVTYISCEMPFTQSSDEIGTNIVVCDLVYGGLFHKSCVGYIEADKEEPNNFWFYQVHNMLLPDEEEADCH